MMNARWSWLARHAIVVIVAVALGAALGAMDLFKTTRIFNKALSASHLAGLIGYGGALVVLWLAAYRATPLLRVQGLRWRLLEVTVLPLATLVVVASAYGVLLLVLGPLMDPTLRQIYNWLFIAGIIGSAAWLVYALFQDETLNGELGAPLPQRPELHDPTPT